MAAEAAPRLPLSGLVVLHLGRIYGVWLGLPETELLEFGNQREADATGRSQTADRPIRLHL